MDGAAGDVADRSQPADRLDVLHADALHVLGSPGNNIPVLAYDGDKRVRVPKRRIGRDDVIMGVEEERREGGIGALPRGDDDGLVGCHGNRAGGEGEGRGGEEAGEEGGGLGVGAAGAILGDSGD